MPLIIVTISFPEVWASIDQVHISMATQRSADDICSENFSSALCLYPYIYMRCEGDRALNLSFVYFNFTNLVEKLCPVNMVGTNALLSITVKE